MAPRAETIVRLFTAFACIWLLDTTLSVTRKQQIRDLQDQTRTLRERAEEEHDIEEQVRVEITRMTHRLNSVSSNIQAWGEGKGDSSAARTSLLLAAGAGR
eukprot:UC1_evm1s162